jgi:hypothetical protein
MNIVLATWYNTLPMTKVSGLEEFDVRPAHAIRALWKATNGDFTKVSSAGHALARHIEILGGLEKASEALNQASDEMRVWDKAEDSGRQSAIRNFELMMATNDPDRRRRITRIHV